MIRNIGTKKQDNKAIIRNATHSSMVLLQSLEVIIKTMTRSNVQLTMIFDTTMLLPTPKTLHVIIISMKCTLLFILCNVIPI